MFKELAFVTVAFAFAFSSVTAQSLIDCQHERAFGKISNIATASDEVLGDFCVDRETGSITGPISLSGLTLTMDDGVNFTFQDLNGSSGNQMQIAPVITATYHSTDVQDQSPEINVIAGSSYFVGYIYNDLAGPSDLTADFAVHVGGGVSVEGGSSLGFQGEAQFVDGAATVALSDNAGYGTTKGTEGAIEIVVADGGTVTGTGTFKTHNIRSAGYRENEWVSITITIDELRGFATGPTGQVIKSYALVTADVIDAEGDMRQENGSFEVFLYDPKIWE